MVGVTRVALLRAEPTNSPALASSTRVKAGGARLRVAEVHTRDAKGEAKQYPGQGEARASG
jgi:hypothetical protein